MHIGRTLLYIAALVSCIGVISATESWAWVPSHHVSRLGSPSQDKLAKKYIETITTEDGQKLYFEMVLIPGGTFLMGSNANALLAPASVRGTPAERRGLIGNSDKGPQHEVRLDSFYLCTTETTIELFLAYYQETVSSREDFVEVQQAKKDAEQAARDDIDAITGPTPVYGDLTMGYEKKHPAIGMTWHNAGTFCRWLSIRTGREYRLPTEAEWEYACRAGTNSVFGFGDDPNLLADFAWYEANSDGQTHEVAKRKPNACGLYDMSGNIREWVYDFYNPTAYNEAAGKSPAVNPKGPKTGKVHVARGGDYDSSPDELRCAARAFEEEWWRSGDPQIPKSKWWLPGMDFIGFRVARSASVRNPRKDSRKAGSQTED